jgi:subtilisin family serine protease
MNMTGRRLLLVVILLFSLSASATAAPSLPVIVHLAPGSNILSIVRLLGAQLVESIPGTNTHLLNLPLGLPLWSPLLFGIQSIEINTSISLPNFGAAGLVTVPGVVGADWYKTQPAWRLIRAGEASAYADGFGVTVADINAKVDSQHPALRGHFTQGRDFISEKPQGYGFLNQSEYAVLDQSEYAVLDQSEYAVLDEFNAILNLLPLNLIDPAHSHGTLTAGVIAAIAPRSMIMPVRAFDDQGRTDLFMLAKAIRWAASNGAHVINMSFGTRTNSKAIRNAIEFAKARGVVLVASAGNDNSSFPQYPAAYSGVLTTAATDLSDKKGGFSNYGSYVFASAPGVKIFSTYPGGGYSIVSGTSFSAPAIAATAALVRSVRTTGISQSIAQGSVDIDNKNPQYANKLGHGRIDVLRAVRPD